MNVAVVGGAECSKEVYEVAREVGRLIAGKRWVLISGGGGGVMEAVCCGAKEEGGVTVGILPGYNIEGANAYLDVKIPTGLGYARNTLVVRAADALIAIAGKYGTLSEIAFAFNEGKKVVGIDTWDIKGVIKVKTPQEAVECINRIFEQNK